MGKKIGTDQFAEFGAAVLRSLPRDIEPGAAQHWILHQDELAEMLKILLAADLVFRVAVDCTMSLAEMIAAGRYDQVDSGITPERCPIQGEGKVERELVLVHFGRVMTTDEPLAELDCRGLRPAKFEELLALGVAHPELQREFPIVAFGTSFVDGNGTRCFACLDGCDGERTLDLDYGVLIPPAHGWAGDFRFLAVRE